MRGIDTNVVIRFLMEDDPVEAGRARAAIVAGDIFASLTVLLETGWVLGSTYGLKRPQIIQALRGFAAIPGVAVEAPAVFAQALDWMEGGMDFADALHLAKAESCSIFLSFDRKLAKRAQGRSPVPVEEP